MTMSDHPAERTILVTFGIGTACRDTTGRVTPERDAALQRG
jgi:hypothetical protein